MNTNRQFHTIPLGPAVLLMVLSILLSGCMARGTEVAPVVSPPAIHTFKDLQKLLMEISQKDSAEAQVQVDELWQSLVDSERVPLILGNQVVFLYKGEAEKVNWRGSFNGWGAPGVEGFRVGETDLWVGNIEFPQASRAEYKIIINDKDWLVDPANSNVAYSGLTGVNNVVTLPGFTVSDQSSRNTDVMPGKLTGNQFIASNFLGYPVHYWVYMPPGYEDLEKLPVIYVLDGNDFVDERMGAFTNVLDNMITSERIQPVFAVFIDSRQPGNPRKNRREDEFLVHPVEHAQFIADELVPVIDQSYSTDPRPEARLIMGVSYGGLSATYIAAARPDVFHNLAAFSPSFWVLNSPQYLPNQEQRNGSSLMLEATNAATECGGETGFPCPRLPLKVFMTTGLPNWDVGDLSGLITALQEQGYPVEFHQVNEGHTWDNWRGLSDEMLGYFFGTD